MHPKLRCPKCGHRVAPFWLDAEWARAIAWGTGELAAYLVAIVIVIAGLLLPAWGLVALFGVALLLVIPSVYWRIIARGKFYCSKCDVVLPRERLFPREEGRIASGDSAS